MITIPIRELVFVFGCKHIRNSEATSTNWHELGVSDLRLPRPQTVAINGRNAASYDRFKVTTNDGLTPPTSTPPQSDVELGNTGDAQRVAKIKQK